MRFATKLEETLKDSVSNILDTTDKDIIEKINKFI